MKIGLTVTSLLVFIAGSLNAAVPLPDSFAPIVKKVGPAVVNISSTRVVRAPQQNMPMDLFDFFGERFPQMPRERRAQSLGSGVIVRADGVVLTNSHVVEGATDITVSFHDRREFKAKLVGNDQPSDIAVLRIEGKDFPTVPLGDTASVQVGDIALAVGNPFGLGQTVTMGIVSATGRGGLGIETYEDFVQTDAAINQGNSGGALVNARGELIGINTAILPAGGGGNLGIGFAIPVYMAREVMDQILKTGKVVRGYLGLVPQDITPSLAKAFGLPDTRGVALTEVVPDSPAGRTGLKPGDVIREVNGQPVNDVNSFRLRISRTPPGTAVKLRIHSDSGPREVSVTLAEFPAEERDRNAEPGRRGGGRDGAALQGVEVDALTPQMARQLRLPEDATGVIVTSVDPSSPAGMAGLRRGDLIEHVNRKPVKNLGEFNAAVRASGSGPVLLLVNRSGRSSFIVVEPK
jgi:serine protease Do